jgi:exodeoxyribonuclease VII large subunit
LLDGIEAGRRRLEQQVRYRLSVAARRLHEQGVDRATTTLHRRIGRQAQRVDELERCAGDHAWRLLRVRRSRLQEVTVRLRRMDLRVRFLEARRRLEMLDNESCQAMRLRLSRAAGRLDPLVGELTQLSPLRVLDRGYALVRDRYGKLVKQPADAPPGTELTIRLAQGEIEARAIAPSGSSELPS